MMNATDNKLKYTADAVNDIEAAIKEKGVDVQPTDALDTYAAKIRSIKSGGDLDFSKIGYDETPQTLKDAIAYAEKIQTEWDDSITNISYKYRYDYNLLFFPKVNFTNIKQCGQLFASSHLLYFPNVDTSNITDAGYMFAECKSLKYLPDLDFTSCKSLAYAFQGLNSLKEFPNIKTSNKLESFYQSCYNSEFKVLPKFITENVTSYRYMFGGNYQVIERIEEISFKSVTDNGTNITDRKNESLRYMLIKDLGFNPNNTICDFHFLENWGDTSTGVTDARKSLIDSLITYSFDRKSTGYSVLTIQLSESVKARLTQDEITQITNKGYTIA